jgi:hypothetical protein
MTKRLRKLLATGKSSRERAGNLGIPRLQLGSLLAMRRADGEERGA